MSARRLSKLWAGGTREHGQALIEFSLILIPFLWMLMGIVDLGRGIFAYNGVGQAARELARTTSVHPCNTSASPCTIGSSPETAATFATQRVLVPGLGGTGSTTTYACTTITDAVLPAVGCPSGAFVRVTVTVPFQVITPLLSMVGPATLSSTSHVQLP